MNCPKTPHDEKKSVKLSLERIELLKESYKKYHNYRLVGRIFHVNHKTVISWVNEDYRKSTIKECTRRQKIRMQDQTYRDRVNKSKRKNQRDRRIDQPEIAKFHNEKRKEYNKNNQEKIKKWRANNRDKINKSQSKHYYGNRDKILADKKEQYWSNK